MGDSGSRDHVRALLRRAGCREGGAEGIGFSVSDHPSIGATLAVGTRDERGVGDLFELYRIASLLRSAGYAVRMEALEAGIPTLAVRPICPAP
jgi:hypothetical protein